MTSTHRPRATGSGGNRKGRRGSFGSVRVLSSGRVQARYTGPDGLTHNAPTTFDTKVDARAWLAVKRSEIVRDAWKHETARPVLFGAYADAWLTGRDVKLRTRQHCRALPGLPDPPNVR